MASGAEAVVVAVARTPFARFEGGLRHMDGPHLAALAIDEALKRSGLSPESIDVAYGGTGMLAAGVLTPMRQAMLLSSLPQSVPSASVDQACCSGMAAIGLAMKDIRLGEARAAICGGFESLSRTPLLWPRQRDRRIGDVTATDPLLLRGLVVDKPIPVYSGEEALRHGIDRKQQDEWAVCSHARYFEADAGGYFTFERFSVAMTDSKGETGTLAADESPRQDASVDKLSKLNPVYGGKTVTAGNAPGLNDGAAFLVLMGREYAAANGIEALARIVDYVQICGSPTSGTTTPAVAIQRIGARNNCGRNDWHLIEINEAYAATPLVSTLVLADGKLAEAQQLRSRTNVHGGAVAIGHPLGASGARITMTLINGLRQCGGGRGVAAICGGFGQGDALMIEVP